MRARLKVLPEVRRHRPEVMTYQNSAGGFGPDENVWVLAPKRQTRWVADPNRIDRIAPARIVALDCASQWAAKMFVQQKYERHGELPFGAGKRLAGVKLGESFA